MQINRILRFLVQSSLWLLAGVVLSSGSIYADGISNGPSCMTKVCTDHNPSGFVAKVTACEIVVASSQCQSLGPDVKLRDCKAEAFCPDSLDQNYIAGCVVGAVGSALNIVEGIVTTPYKLIEMGVKRADYEAKYFNSATYQACTNAEDKVAKNPASTKLDCEKSFWHSACPRTLVRNCKDQLLEQFPDIRKAYGSGYPSIQYDQVLTDVRNRLRAIDEAKISVAKFLKEHPEHPFQALTTEVGQELARQGYKLACMSSYDASHFSCDAVIKAVAIVAGGYSVISKIGKAADAVEGLEAQQSIRMQTSKGETTMNPTENAGAALVDTKLAAKADDVFADPSKPTGARVKSAIGKFLATREDAAQSAELSRMDDQLASDVSNALDKLPAERRNRLLKILAETKKGQPFSKDGMAGMPYMDFSTGGAVAASATKNPHLVMQAFGLNGPIARMSLRHEFSHLSRLDAGDVSAKKAFKHVNNVTQNRRLGLYREELQAFGDQYDYLRKLYSAEDVPRLKELFPPTKLETIEYLKSSGILKVDGKKINLDFTHLNVDDKAIAAVAEYFGGRTNDAFTEYVEQAVRQTKSQFTKENVGGQDYRKQQLNFIRNGKITKTLTYSRNGLGASGAAYAAYEAYQESLKN